MRVLNQNTVSTFLLRQKSAKKGDPKTMYIAFSGAPRRTIELCATVVNSSGSLVGSQTAKCFFLQHNALIQ